MNKQSTDEGSLGSLTILIVDDDEAVRDSLAGYLSSEGWQVSTADCAEAGLEKVQSGEGDIVVSDICMPGMDGITFLTKLRELAPDIEVLITTGFSTEELAIKALRAGAFDYFRKPLKGPEISAALHRSKRFQELRKENTRLRALLGKYTLVDNNHSFVGQSSGAARLVDLVTRVAASPGATVLLTGESGVGKEVAARMIHQQSHPEGAPFVAVNCGGIAENLLESELFGHEKGAFTGADRRVPGVFEMAEGGTVFLDEISEMSAQAQSRFLRILEDRRFRRLGGTKEVEIKNLRIIAATNRDLKACAENDEFREDLYYRIMVAPIHIPPLRERREDIIPLAHYFLQQIAKRTGRKFYMSGEFERSLTAHDFPGNVRDLRNTIERATIFAPGDELQVADLGIEQAPRVLSSHTETTSPPNGLKLAEHEGALIREALKQHPDNHAACARALGISPQALYRKLEKHDIK